MTLALPFIDDDLPDLYGGLPEFATGARWYQEEAIERIEHGFRSSDSQLAVLATGLGKSYIAASVANRCDGPVLWMVHGNELVMQARDELEKMTGAYVEVEQGDYKASGQAKIIVASVDSLRQEARKKRLGKDRFRLTIFDEAHMALAKTYREALEYFSAKRLGLTATPDRGDEKALGQVFDSVAYVMDIEDGIVDGHLVPILGQRVFVKEIDLEGVGKSKGDLVDSQLDEVMMKAVEGIVVKTLELYPDRHGLAFFPGVRTAEYAMQRFNQLQPDSTAFVDGKTDPYVRRQIIEDFRRGKYKRLTNCQVFTTGFDAPIADLIIGGRPTLSRAFYTQCIGRGTRPAKGVLDHLRSKHQAEARRAAIAASVKPNAVVLDFVGNSGKHSLVSLEDALGGSFTEEEIALAKKQKNKGDKPVDARETLLKARRELLLKAMHAKAKRVDADVHPFDPFVVLGVHVKDEDRYTDRFGVRPATEGQVALLRQKGVPEKDLSTLSKVAAGKLIDQLVDRHSRGLATYKQLRQLQRFGYNENLREPLLFDRASAGINYIVQKDWGRGGKVDTVVLNEILRHERASGED